MIRLSNQAEVHAAFLLPASPGMKANGLVLAETEHDWVTWTIHQDPGQLIWDCETGHYFQKNMLNNPGMGDPKQLAHFDFGFRVRRIVNIHMLTGMQHSLEDRVH